MQNSRFFREAERQGRRFGFHASGITDDGKLEFSSNHHYLCRVDERGVISYPQHNEPEIRPFICAVEAARKYVAAVEQAPPLLAEGLGSGYVRLAEFEDTVLAGKDMGGNGYQFITWQWTHDHTGLYHGHYYDNFAKAKEDFAYRSGLAPEHHRYTMEQAKALHDVIAMSLDRNLTQYRDDRDYLQQCQEKLEQAYPKIGEQMTVLVVERDKPAEVRSIPKSTYAIETAIGGSLDTSGWEGNIRYYFNGDLDPNEIDPGDYRNELISRILPDGAVLGTMVIAGWDQDKRELRSLTAEEIQSERIIMDAPEHQPDRSLNIEPTMGM